MRAFKLFAAAAALIYTGTAQAAPLTDYSSVLVFGDSLTDSGNARIGSLALGLPDPAPPSEGYVAGRFSNGLNFADRLAVGVTGQPATAYLQGGNNFSVGGATAAYSPTETRPSFLTQLGIFQSTLQPIAGDALVLVTFGGNDIRATVGTPGKANFSATLTAFAQGLGALVTAGARNIVVTGIPDIGQLPPVVAAGMIDPTIPTLATSRSRYLNYQFSKISSDLEQATGADITFFNLFGFQQQITARPEFYGLPANFNTTVPCKDVPGAVAQGCDGFLYFDNLHPTQQVHSVIAQRIERQLLTGVGVPEPATWTLMIVGFGLVGASLRRRSAVALAA